MKYTASQKNGDQQTKPGYFFQAIGGEAAGIALRSVGAQAAKCPVSRCKTRPPVETLATDAKSRIHFAGCPINGISCFTGLLLYLPTMHRQRHNNPLLQPNAGEVGFRA